MKAFIQEYGLFLVSLIAAAIMMVIFYFMTSNDGYKGLASKLIAEISGIHYSDVENAEKVMEEYGLEIEVD